MSVCDNGKGGAWKSFKCILVEYISKCFCSSWYDHSVGAFNQDNALVSIRSLLLDWNFQSCKGSYPALVWINRLDSETRRHIPHSPVSRLRANIYSSWVDIVDTRRSRYLHCGAPVSPLNPTFASPLRDYLSLGSSLESETHSTLVLHCIGLDNRTLSES